jgi:hypothetical protein
MPIKKYTNTLRVRKLAATEMLSFVTSSKKSHFTVSEAKLCEHLQWVTNTSGSFFTTYVSLVPTVAIHVHGGADILDKHADWLEQQISTALTDLHDDGRDKVKPTRIHYTIAAITKEHK